MDVQLPDGTVVQGVPDGTTKMQLAQKLHDNGRAVPPEWLAPPAGAQPETPGRLLGGAAEVAGASVANIPHDIGSALVDAYRRITGADPNAPEPRALSAIHVEPGQAGKDFGPAVAGALEQGIDKLGGGDAATSAVGAVNQGASALDQAAPTLTRKVLPIAADAAVLAGARGIPGAVGDAARSAGEAAQGVRTAVSGSGFDVPEQPGLSDLGVSAPSNPPLAPHQQTANVVAAHEAGLPPGAGLSLDGLPAAREAPSAVYNRVAMALPDAPLDATAAGEVAAAGQPEGGRVSKGSPQAQAQIEALRQQLLDQTPKTGQQWLNELRALRQEGYNARGSDDISNQQLGAAQLDMARAIEGHIGRNIPSDADVSLDQFLKARTDLAKNFAVQAALRGNDIDMQALARVQRADPELLSGGLKAIADYAAANPEQTRLSNRFLPSMGDALNGVSLTRPATWLKPVLAAGQRVAGSAEADAATANAAAAFPARDPAQFAPIARPLELRPPPGRAYEAHQPDIPGTGSLADLLRGPDPLKLQPSEGSAGGPHQPSLFGDESLAELLAPQKAARMLQPGVKRAKVEK